MSWLSQAFSPPKPPTGEGTLNTANQVANQQQGFNVAAQQGSMVNQSNPWGTLNYTQTGVGANGVPIYSASTGISSQAQPIWNNMFSNMGAAGGQAGAFLGNANYGSQDPATAIGDMSSGLAGQRMGSYLSSVEPFFETERTNLDTQLKNQGFLPGQKAYDTAMRGMDNNHSLATYKAAAEYQPQAFGQATSLYQMPLNMSQQLMNLSNPQDPSKSLVQTPQLQAADATSAYGLANKASMDQYNAQMGQYGGLLSGLSNVAGAGLGLALSDERLKENIEDVGSLYDGTPVYKYNYLDDPAPKMGVMAQDVEKRRPDAVHEFGGIKMVDYDKATARARAMKALLS